MMTSREQLPTSYLLAFYPPRLNEVCHQIRNQTVSDLDELGIMLDTALLLHQALPCTGYQSQRALTRLAIYQAKSRAFGMVWLLKNIRHALGRPPLTQTEVPGERVRDIHLPPLARACVS